MEKIVYQQCDNNKLSVIVKSYSGDIQWIIYCLLSLIKHLKLTFDIKIVVPMTDLEVFKPLSRINEIISVLAHEDMPITKFDLFDFKNKGYVEQMVVKLWADNFTNSEYIMMIDSDTTLCTDLIWSDIRNDNGDVINKYRDWPLGPHTDIWRPRVEFMLKNTAKYDTMVGQGYVYRHSTFSKCRDYIKTQHDQSAYNFLIENANNISEFEFLGNCALTLQLPGYIWSNVTKRSTLFKQKWSWGGLKADVIDDIRICL